MAAPIDYAMMVLKTLPEQQMFSQPRTANLGQEQDYEDMGFAGKDDSGDPVSMSNHGMYRYGTVHPAIAGMLARRPEMTGWGDPDYPDLNLEGGPIDIEQGQAPVGGMIPSREYAKVPPKGSMQDEIDSNRGRATAETPEDWARRYAGTPAQTEWLDKFGTGDETPEDTENLRREP